MSMIIHFANMIFKPIINLGAAPMMMIVLTLIALCFKVKFSKALEGGIKLAINRYQPVGYRRWMGPFGNEYLGFSVHAVFFVGNGCRKYYHACAQ